LRNGIVHGAAHRIAVSLARVGAQIELTVTDDGRGFDLEAVRRTGGGLGLVSIEERASAIGGNVEILTGLGKGTAVYVRAPAKAGASV
jgi:signal transduction histidine kinase